MLNAQSLNGHKQKLRGGSLDEVEGSKDGGDFRVGLEEKRIMPTIMPSLGRSGVSLSCNRTCLIFKMVGSTLAMSLTGFKA